MRKFTPVLALLLFLTSGCGKFASGNKEAVFFEIRKGDSIQGISRNLQEQGIIRDAAGFRLYAKLTFRDSKLKFGLYQIEPSTDYSSLLNMFREGKIYTARITIPEGNNIYQVADILAENNMVNKNEFIALCTNQIFISTLGIPAKKTIEGYLFPDTYQFPPNLPAARIIQTMVNNFKKNMEGDIARDIKSRGLKIGEVITMASIIEKEARVQPERALISGVYYQRLRIRMMMQSCPTVIYSLILEGKYNGKLYTRDLNYPSEYNTYIHYGLPPSPIANPGLSSIIAAIRPEKTD